MSRLAFTSWCLTFVLTTLCGAGAVVQDATWPAPRVDEGGVLRPAAWLGLGRVDATGRRPFRPEAVLAHHILAPGAPAPRAGQELSGELGEPRAWERREADDDGGPGGGVAWAYTALHVDTPRVMLARAHGASTLWVNGEAFAGDVYRFGNDGVPVSLVAGRNDVYVTGIRGAFRFSLHPVAGALTVGARDQTTPMLVRGDDSVGPAGLLVMNTSTRAVDALRVTMPGDELFAPLDVRLRGLGPLGLRKLPLPLALRDGARVPDELTEWATRVRIEDPRGGARVEHTLTLGVVASDQPRRVTFVSRVDGSAQFWGLRPPAPAPEPTDAEPADTAPAKTGGAPGALTRSRPADDPHLVLSLHGAGVDALAQARCYAPRPDRWVAAPTNRRPFGFDHQDWGRLDAYEVLDEALALSGVDRRRVGLTGHSMGGHGAWHLAANDADGFSAVAPSAGWESFDSYGGRPEGALAELWQTADQPSRTLEFVDNLARMPVFVLHGDADDNVPASEGRNMLEALRAAGAEPASHFEPGKGHWWDGPASPGTDCLDWPELAELLATSTIPDDPDEIAFTSAGPGVDDRHHWLRVEQELSAGAGVVRIGARWPDERAELSTDNVRRLEILPRPGRALHEVVIDDQLWSRAALDDIDLGRTRLEGHWLLVDGFWEPSGPTPAHEPRPARRGPFKRAFDNDFVLVPGTAGSAVETRALAARARYDAQVWWYRGNGRAEIVTDREFLAGDFSGRNVLFYGNADTNAAWRAVLGDGCPLDARRGGFTYVAPDMAGPDTLTGDDRAALWIWPRADDPDTMVGVFADTGLAGTRLGFALPTFVSGVGFTDWVAFGPGILTDGDGGVLAGGWYDHDWTLQFAVPFKLPWEGLHEVSPK